MGSLSIDIIADIQCRGEEGRDRWDTSVNSYVLNPNNTNQIYPDLYTVFNDIDSDQLIFSVEVPSQGITTNIIDSLLYVSTQSNIYGNFEVIVRAMDELNQSVADTFLVTIFPVNDPPVLTGIPDTLYFSNDEAETINLWNYVEDDQTPDSLILFSFSQSDTNLHVNYKF